MLKFFVENNVSNIILSKEELAIVMFKNGIMTSFAIISINGTIYQPNDHECPLYNTIIKEDKFKEVEFFDVYGKVDSKNREEFVKELYDIYTKFNSKFSSNDEFYIGEITDESTAAHYDKLAEAGVCVKYLYVKLDKYSEAVISTKFRNPFRVMLKASNKNKLFLSSTHIPINTNDSEYIKEMQTPATFKSIDSAKQAIMSTRRIITFAFNFPMIFKKNSDGTFKLVCCC